MKDDTMTENAKSAITITTDKQTDNTFIHMLNCKILVRGAVAPEPMPVLGTPDVRSRLSCMRSAVYETHKSANHRNHTSSYLGFLASNISCFSIFTNHLVPLVVSSSYHLNELFLATSLLIREN